MFMAKLAIISIRMLCCRENLITRLKLFFEVKADKMSYSQLDLASSARY